MIWLNFSGSNLILNSSVRTEGTLMICMRKIDEKIRAARMPKGHRPSKLEGVTGDPGGFKFGEG